MIRSLYQPPFKFQTPCCAMFQLVAKDYHTKEDLLHIINKAKREAEYSWHTGDRTSGERSCYIIISPGEDNLERNVVSLGFKCVNNNMPRRNGYPKGVLKMYMLSW